MVSGTQEQNIYKPPFIIKFTIEENHNRKEHLDKAFQIENRGKIEQNYKTKHTSVCGCVC